MSSHNNSKGIIKPLIWWIAFGASFLLFFAPVPTLIGMIAAIVTFIGVATASKPLIMWIAFGASFLLFFAPVSNWFGVLAVIVTLIGALVVNEMADEEEKKRLKALAKQGDVQAQYDLACWYQRREKWSDAIHWFEKAAKAGHAQAQSALPQAQSALEAANKERKTEAVKPPPTVPRESDFGSGRIGLIEYYIADANFLFEQKSYQDYLKYDVRKQSYDRLKDQMEMAGLRGMLSATLRVISEKLWDPPEPLPDKVACSLRSLVDLVDPINIENPLSDTGQTYLREIHRFLSLIQKK